MANIDHIRWEVRLSEWLWGFLPDNCEIEGCCRKGMRGNENVMTVFPFTDVVVCDYCSSRYMSGEVLRVRW